MWIQIKTYEIKKEEDICSILDQNKIKRFENAYEIVFRDVKKCSKKVNKNLDMVFIEAQTTLVQQNNSSSTLFRENCITRNICFTNVKNDKGKYLSVLIDNLCENDRILIIGGVLIKNNFKFIPDRLTVAVRPQNNSSVFLFKYVNTSLLPSLPVENLNLHVEKNLSKLTLPGIYSLFGHISKIIKYTDKEYILLRIKCCDKTSVKIYKYPHSVQVYEDISKEERSYGTKYDYHSNEVDILVKKPSTDFNLLVLHQRIFLNNIKMKCSNNQKIYLLKVKGDKINLKADPIETCSLNSLRPPAKHFPIPNELKPVSPSFKRKQTSSFKKSPSKVKKSKNTFNDSLDSSSSDIVDELCMDLNQVFNKNVNINHEASTSFSQSTKTKMYNLSPVKNTEIKSSSPVKKTQTNNKFNGCKNDIPITHQKENVCELSSDGSSSPLFFQTEVPVPVINQETRLNKINLSSTNLTRSTQCLGPCRLLLTEPNIFFDDNFSNNIVSGYCTNNCFSFYPKTVLNKHPNVDKYNCPKCFSSISLTLFFKMNFVYGRDEDRAIEVCCYNENAQRVINKLTKQKLKLEDYLSDNNNRKLIIDTFKTVINNKTKMNIVVSDSPVDKTKILMTVDTKYVVTTF